MKNVYIFDYKEGWMILLYKDGKEDTYWNSSEDDWDRAWKVIDLLELPKENVYYWKLESYDRVNQIVEDVFYLNEYEIRYLEQFRLKR